MSAWKKLNRQDVTLTVHNAKKSWELSNGDFAGNGIRTFLASSGSVPRYILDSTDIVDQEYTPLLYRSIDQLYYRNFASSSKSLFTSSSYYNYFESSETAGSRYLDSDAFILSIPRSLTGDNIEPGSLSIGVEVDGYVEEGYYVEGYVLEESTYIDDREGRIVRISTNGDTTAGGPIGDVLGNVIYSHGLIIFTNPQTARFLNDELLLNLSFKSNLPIYTLSYNIGISEDEFNYTYNTTLQTSGSLSTSGDSSFFTPSGLLKEEFTDSNFSPYITSIGLYNDANELIAVAKLGQPLPKSKTTETTVKVKLDM